MKTVTFDETLWQLIPTQMTGEMHCIFRSRLSDNTAWIDILQVAPKHKEKIDYSVWFGFDNHTFRSIDMSDKLKAFIQIQELFTKDSYGSVFVKAMASININLQVYRTTTPVTPDIIVAFLEKFYALPEYK